MPHLSQLSLSPLRRADPVIIVRVHPSIVWEKFRMLSERFLGMKIGHPTLVALDDLVAVREPIPVRTAS